MFLDLASSLSDVFNFFDQLVFRVFMLGSACLTAGLLLRPSWRSLRGHGQKRSAHKGRTTRAPRAGSHNSVSEMEGRKCRNYQSKDRRK
jgi:hypothetical protein